MSLFVLSLLFKIISTSSFYYFLRLIKTLCYQSSLLIIFRDVVKLTEDTIIFGYTFMSCLVRWHSQISVPKHHQPLHYMVWALRWKFNPKTSSGANNLLCVILLYDCQLKWAENSLSKTKLMGHVKFSYNKSRFGL